VAVRGLVTLVSHCQQLERAAGEPPGPALVRRAAAERLTPVLTTALATGLALVPLVMQGNVPGQELLQPLAVVVLGGLVTSTLLTLFVVPALYLRFGSGSSRRLDAAH
jgi:Cu/Ag efflux pump CusA